VAFWLVAARSLVVRDPPGTLPGAHLDLTFLRVAAFQAFADSDNDVTTRLCLD
jgi:hypothetical protein